MISRVSEHQEAFVRQLDRRFLVAAVALIAAACSSSKAQSDARIYGSYSVSRPSNSSVLFPGEYSYTAPVSPLFWRLPQF